MRLLRTFGILPIIVAASMSACLGGGSWDASGGAGAGSGVGGSGAGPLGTTSGTGGGNGNSDDASELALDDNAGNGTGGGGTTAGSGGGGGVGGAGGAGGAGTGGSVPACAETANSRTFYMSPDDSSSMGSPALAREFLRAGEAPPRDVIRPYEFLNYYRVRYDLPTGDKLGLHTHFAQDVTTGKYRLHVGVQAFSKPRPKMVLTFVADNSGSLVGEGIARERAAIKALAKQLKPGDVVNFIKWSSSDSDVLINHVVTSDGDQTVSQKADELSPGGGSDLHAGIVRGYDVARKYYDSGALNRVVLLSDGGANLGVLDSNRIAQEASEADNSNKPIYLVGIGVGPAKGYTDKLMDSVTDSGRGSYVYLDSTAEADAVLGARFDEVMNVAAREVRIAVTIPDYFEIATFSGEVYSTDPSLVKPQHLAPGDAVVLDQTLTLNPNHIFCDIHTVTLTADWLTPASGTAPLSDTVTATQTFAEVTAQPWQMLKSEAIFYYAKALQTQAKTDFVVAEQAVQKVLNLPNYTALDMHSAEVKEIEDLLKAFPESSKQD
ncbi:MAG: von Willebrand factor type A domain-containing protein [Polyangiaceae bacterium]|nr:von Willebrand factor type A domain-containing protein [Polyangiaceae bacterium]